VAVPDAPRVIVPRDRSAFIDPLSPLILRKSDFADDDITSASTAVATSASSPSTVALELEDEDTSGGNTTWTSETKLLTGNGNANDMASATRAGVCNVVNWGGFDTGLSDTLRVKDVEVSVLCEMYWPSTVPGPGSGRSRFVVEYAGKRVHVEDYVPSTPGAAAPGAVPATEVTFSIDSYLREELGELYTIGDLEAAGADLRLFVMSYANGPNHVATWRVSVASLRVTYWDVAGTPDRQSQFQFQIARDSGFTDVEFDTGVVLDHAFNRNHYIMPARKLSGGGTKYARCRTYDTTPSASAWSSTSTFSVLSDATARLLHNPSSEAAWLIEIEAVRWVEATKWERVKQVGSTVKSKTYRCNMPRSGEIVEAFFVRDLEANGRRKNATQLDDPSDLEATPNAFVYDETGYYADKTTPAGAAGDFYVHVEEDEGATSPSALRGLGLGVVLVVPLSTAQITTGPRGGVPYLPVVTGVPRFKESIRSFADGHRVVPQGGITLSNLMLTFDTQRKLFNQLLQVIAPNPGRGWIFDGRPVMVKLIGPGMRYSEAVEVFSGTVTYDDSGLWRNDMTEVSLTVRSIEAKAIKARIAENTVTVESYPNAPSGSIGKTIPLVYGAGHLRRPAIVIDEGDAGIRTAKLLVGENVSAVSKLYQDGTELRTGWSFSSATQTITLTSTTVADIDAYRAAVWTWDGAGPALNDYAGIPSSTLQAGTLFKELLGKMGIPSSLIVSQAFNALDDPDQGGETYAVRCAFDEPTLAKDALDILQRTRRTVIIPRADGMFDVVSSLPPTDADSYTCILDELDRRDLTIQLSRDNVGRSVSVEFWEYAGDPIETIGRRTRESRVAPALWLSEKELTVETYHATKAGAEAVLADWQLDEPQTLMQLSTGRRTLFLPPGATLVPQFSEAADESGVMKWRLWSILERDIGVEGSSLLLERGALLPVLARPGL